MLLVGFVAAFAVLAHSATPCTVRSCAARMSEVANAFTCQDDGSCRAALTSAVAAVAPVDAADEWQRLGADFLSFLQSLCQTETVCNNTFNTFDSRVFVSWNDASRVPDASLAVAVQLDSATSHLEDLQNNICFVPENGEETDAWRASGCEYTLRLATLRVAAIRLRQFYALRRERAFLSDLSRACLVWAGTSCSAVVGEAADAMDAEIARVKPAAVDPKLFFAVGLRRVFKEVNNRTCGAVDPGRQCVAELVQPVLAAQGDARAMHAAFDTMLAFFEPSSPAASDALFAEMTKNASKPTINCGFAPATTIGVFASPCRQLVDERSDAYFNFMSRSPWLLVTRAQVDALEARWRFGMRVCLSFLL